MSTIYLTAPHSVDETRYERYYYLVSHHFKGAVVLEGRELFPMVEDWLAGWASVLDSIDTLIFVRHEKNVTAEMFDEISQAHKAGCEVLMACTQDEKLVLTDWDELKFAAQAKGMRKCTIWPKVGVAV
jgi:hypothetical protein